MSESFDDYDGDDLYDADFEYDGTEYCEKCDEYVSVYRGVRTCGHHDHDDFDLHPGRELNFEE